MIFPAERLVLKTGYCILLLFADQNYADEMVMIRTRLATNINEYSFEIGYCCSSELTGMVLT